MAKTITLTDDLDGKPGAKERIFAVGGVEYSIDLTDENYESFLAKLEPYRSVASISPRTRRSNYPTLNQEARRHIRVWAEANGQPLAPRGRFPIALVEKYLEEMSPRSQKTV